MLLRIVRQILRDEERRCFVRQLNIAMRTDFKVAVTFTSLEISGENRVWFFLRRAVGRDASAPWEEQAPAGCVLVLSSVVRSRRLRKRVPVPARKFLRWDKGIRYLLPRGTVRSYQLYSSKGTSYEFEKRDENSHTV